MFTRLNLNSCEDRRGRIRWSTAEKQCQGGPADRAEVCTVSGWRFLKGSVNAFCRVAVDGASSQLVDRVRSQANIEGLCIEELRIDRTFFSYKEYNLLYSEVLWTQLD